MQILTFWNKKENHNTANCYLIEFQLIKQPRSIWLRWKRQKLEWKKNWERRSVNWRRSWRMPMIYCPLQSAKVEMMLGTQIQTVSGFLLSCVKILCWIFVGSALILTHLWSFLIINCRSFFMCVYIWKYIFPSSENAFLWKCFLMFFLLIWLIFFKEKGEETFPWGWIIMLLMVFWRGEWGW